ncbi:MAG TPA: MBL fold metallo-hydrolase [Micromonosporaceae bacterium]|jgi:N-acyl homoserine lactone hydrolase
MSEIEVHRIDFGYVIVPARPGIDEPPHVLPCLGYVIVHASGVVLFDTGIGQSERVDARYRPRRRALTAALAAAGTTIDDVTHVANCHLHYDHCGGNAALAGRPIFTQRTELVIARNTPGYTIPELVEPAGGVTYEEVDGDFEVLPGVLIVPTPGHTDGHQSLVVRRADGTIIVAGQSHDTSSSYGADVLSWHERRRDPSSDLPPPPGWIERLQALDPRRVVFAHDNAVWEPSES